ncbi:hypothetical protein B6K85_10850 [Vibrio sp. V1B]|uniref:DUF262 domain-containing HNH endonuclease family protein n=1 Tax=Vibrio sp. V1B TaxID=2047825 RepID=UPI000BB0A97C|nr:DUF262 domain-containing protein [Vibrio sp. V1B]PAW10584.1 hypothetical protein B6K85_10850 [Vibrio sp. V1B]
MDIKKVKDIFDAKSECVFSLLASNGIAFQIPDYQRKYSWKEDNISRLIEDICYGVNNLHTDEESLTFLGTVIVTSIQKKEDMPALPLSVVDGQQRLSTIVLILAYLHSYLSKLSQDIGGVNKFEQAILSEVKRLSNEIKKCLFENYGMSDDVYDLYPIITRDIDNWGNDEYSASYLSPISKFLFNYAEHIEKNNVEDFDFIPDPDDEAEMMLKSRFQFINKKIGSILVEKKEEDGTTLIYYEDICSSPEFIDSSFNKPEGIKSWLFGDDFELEQSGEEWSPTVNFKSLVRLIPFSRYLLERVCLTKVESTEKYAFDVFEALNTTGEPLTALETFKPRLISYINQEKNNNKAYSNSGSKKYFDQIDEYLTDIGEDKKQNETQDLVISFALYYTGAKVSKHLSIQRKYLRDRFEQVNNEHEAENFVNSFFSICDYKSKFWSEVDLPDQLRGIEQRELVLCCLEFLRKANKSLTVPVLSRYYVEAKKQGNMELFVNAVKAITAFTIIWRSSFSTSSAIDSVYREIMSYGYKKKKKFKAQDEVLAPCFVGVHEENILPNTSELCDILKLHLNAKGIGNYDDWYIRVKSLDVYNISGPIAKMCLLMSLHRTRSDEAGALIKDGRRNHNETIRLDIFKSDLYSTIEHVAPRTPSKGSSWDSSIYDDAYTINTLGNLILMPQAENSSVGNKSWESKRTYFKCFCQENEHDLNKAVEDAGKIGITMSNNVKALLEQGSCLSMLKPLVSIDKWDRDFINERTENLANLLWAEASSWLDQASI